MEEVLDGYRRDPSNNSYHEEYTPRGPTDVVTTFSVSRAIANILTLCCYRHGRMVSVRETPEREKIESAMKNGGTRPGALALRLIKQYNVTDPNAKVGSPGTRPEVVKPRDNANYVGRAIVPLFGDESNATYASVRELMQQLFVVATADPKLYVDASTLISERGGGLASLGLITGPCLDGVQPVWTPNAEIDRAIAELDVGTNTGLAIELGATLLSLDISGVDAKLWMPGEASSPLMAGVDEKSDVGKRLAELAAVTHVATMLAIYCRQLARLAVEIWDPIYQLISKSTTRADLDAHKRWQDIVDSYRKHIPLHPLLATVLPGAPPCESPEGTGRAYLLPQANGSDMVQRLFTKAFRNASAPSSDPAYVWRLAPGLGFLRGDEVNAALQEVELDAEYLRTFDLSRPGVIAYVASRLPTSRPGSALDVGKIILDRSSMTWVSDDGTSAPYDSYIRGYSAGEPVASTKARPVMPAETIMPYTGTYTVVPLMRVSPPDPARALAYEDGTFLPPRARNRALRLGLNAENLFSLSALSAAYAHRKRLTTAAALPIVQAAVRPSASTTPSPGKTIAVTSIQGLGDKELFSAPTGFATDGTLVAGDPQFYTGDVGVLKAPVLSSAATTVSFDDLAASGERVIECRPDRSFGDLACHVPLNTPVTQQFYIAIQGGIALYVATTLPPRRYATLSAARTAYTGEALADALLNRIVLTTDAGVVNNAASLATIETPAVTRAAAAGSGVP